MDFLLAFDLWIWSFYTKIYGFLNNILVDRILVFYLHNF
jgi:hypothetical protein